MELIKKQVHMNKCNCKNNIQVTLSNDFNVPDVKADVLSLIKDNGEVTVEEVRFASGKGTVRGKLDFQVLYLGDEGTRPVCDLGGSIPFEEMVALESACQDDDLSVKCTIDDLQTELINSRKIGVKAIITLEVLAEALYDGEGAVGIDGADDILFQKKMMDVTQMAICKKDTFRYRDEWNLAATKDTIGKVLYENISLLDMDTRPVEDKINISGQVKLFFLYMSDGEEPKLEFYENIFPISGSIDCNGCDESMVPLIDVGIHNKDLVLKEDEDGEKRIIDLELVLELMIKIYRREEMEVLTDFYAMDCELKPIFTDSYFENLLMKNVNKNRVTGKINLQENERPLQIWNVDGTLFIDQKEIVPEGIKVSGVIDASILYVSAEDNVPLGSLKGSVPFEQIVEIKGINDQSTAFINGNIDQVSAVMLGEGEIEIKAIVSLEVIAFDKIVLPMISDYTVEELDRSLRGREPGLVGYVVKEGESLWDIAKAFYTTMDSIMELNGLEREDVKRGDMLLLMKEIETV